MTSKPTAGIWISLQAAHLLEHRAIDAMLVPLVADYEVRLPTCREHGRLGRRVGHERDLDLMAALEHRPHRAERIRAQAGDSGEHRWPYSLFSSERSGSIPRGLSAAALDLD